MQESQKSSLNAPAPQAAQRIPIDPVREAQLTHGPGPARWPGSAPGLSIPAGQGWLPGTHAVPEAHAAPANVAVPPCELFDEGPNYLCCIDLPGVQAASIDLRCSEDWLAVAARREWDAQFSGTAGANPTHQRSIPLPMHVRPDGVKAVLRDGVLTVTIPKALASPVPRRIEIQ